ncbi:MAG TPA: hypothetical protein VFW98_18110 [Gemmatimonadaceae bacterium]|nr:hypothetical protein [Gemmatimonadaceae bacterium]
MNRTASLALALFFLAGCRADAPTGAKPSTDPGASLDLGASLEMAGSGPTMPTVQAQLAQVRRVTARFHDLDAAMAAGYTVWAPDPSSGACLSNATGNMGHHLINPALEDGNGGPDDPLDADPNIDLLHPERLLYEKRADGKMHLVGVEYLVLGVTWDAVHDDGDPTTPVPPPMLFGHPFVHSVHGHVGLPVPHYELHVWVWKANPNGMFAQFNPNVTC